MEKSRAASELLLSRLNFSIGAHWRVVLDRMRCVCNEDPEHALVEKAGWLRVQSSRLARPRHGRFQAYQRAAWFQRLNDDTKIAVESERTQHWLWPYRVTLVADDAVGLLPRHVLGLLESLPDFRLTMLEIAFDFAGEMTRREARGQILFGKTRPAPSVGSTDYWGSRKGMKRGEFYFKRELQVSRFELELTPRFLAYYEIADPFDFVKLVEILPSHFSFHVFNEQKLLRRLNRMGIGIKRQHEILGFIARLDGDLWSTLNYLRQEVGMANTRRLLDDSPRNGLILKELKTWAAKWPNTPTRLVGKTK